ncbi:hypothetical protein M3Y98_00007200 [Aphelenchoides besseyi]|nr:hypothetical protein M3Y98_00007200 [Aphelenchoides besseyi]
MNAHDTTAALFESTDRQFEEIFGGSISRLNERKQTKTTSPNELEVQVENLKRKLIKTERELSEAKKRIEKLETENQQLRESRTKTFEQPSTNENAEDLRRQNARLFGEERIVRYKPNNPYDEALKEHKKKKADTSSKN